VDALFHAPEHLRDLALDLRFFLADERDHVAQDIERWDTRITGAGHRLHRDREHLPDAERFVKWCEGHGRYRGGAVGVGDDAATPPALGALALQQRQMVRVHLRNHERDIRIHPEVLRVAEHDRAGASECGLDVASGRRVQRGEDDW
jgi:hypothetical protein